MERREVKVANPTLDTTDFYNNILNPKAPGAERFLGRPATLCV